MRSFLIRTIFFLLTFIASKAGVAAVFTVTSNSDSGPGTLRQALLDAAANGSIEKDFIHFNLPDLSEEGRTIVLINELPALTSRLTIDGSTQIGSVFGQSNARVKLSSPVSFAPFTMFKATGIENIEIDGLYIYDFTGINTLRPDQKQRNGIVITQSSDIVIGSTGKGNLIRGYNDNCINISASNDLRLQSNVFGLGSKNNFDSDEAGGPYDYTAPVRLIKCSNVLIGGNGNDANYIFCYVFIEFAKNSDAGSLNIRYNNIGVLQDNKSFTWMYQALVYFTIYTEGMDHDGLLTGSEINSLAKATINIENNLGGNFGNVFRIRAIRGLISFYENFLGVTRDGNVNLNNNSHPNEGVPINIGNCPEQILIGGNDLTKRNFLAFANAAVSVIHCPKVRVQNNEFECLKSGVFYNPDDQLLLSIDKVINQNAQTTVVGKANAGAIIDIYSSENCTYANCSIRAFVKSVMADGNGNWTSVIPNLTGIFYASATINNSITSEFKTIEINTSNIVIKNIRCDDYAYITGLTIPEGLSCYWEDQNGVKIATTINLKIDKEGTYRLVLADGCITSDWYVIRDYRIQINATAISTVNANCANNDGAITGLTFFDPLYKVSGSGWKNSAGFIVSNATNANNLQPGTYTFTVSTTDGCTATYGPITLTSLSGPNINQAFAEVTPTNCGQHVGSIKGIIATGTGTLKYSWKNQQQQEVGTTVNLLNQPAGKYTLQVTDGSACGPVYTTSIEIFELNGIILDESSMQIKVANCNNNNGQISGIAAPGATTYKWTDANNIAIGNTLTLRNVAAGSYTLTVSNGFGCVQTKNYQVGQKTTTIYPYYPVNISNACNGINNGSITVSTGGPAISERWTNSQGETVGSGKHIENLSPGTYKLYLTDDDGCESLYKSYNLTDLQQLTSPMVNNIDVCSPGKATLAVITLTPGFRYRLYESENSITPLNERTDGRFTIDVKGNTQYYVSQITGTCESTRAPVKITVGFSSLYIANTFTPNDDGINDYWKITGIEDSPNATVQVFNRAGQTVFNSKGYVTPFNGILNGKNLPTGTYYYIINMGAACGVLSGAITILR